MTMALDPFEFCQHVENRRRCVAPRGHVGEHDLQPFGARSVQDIVRREDNLVRLGWQRPETDSVVPAIMTALEDTETQAKAKK